jgi:hypothetical protein
LVGVTFEAGEVPVTIDMRWFHAFDTEKRVTGDSVFATLSLPLDVYPGPAPATKPLVAKCRSARPVSRNAGAYGTARRNRSFI